MLMLLLLLMLMMMLLMLLMLMVLTPGTLNRCQYQALEEVPAYSI